MLVSGSIRRCDGNNWTGLRHIEVTPQLTKSADSARRIYARSQPCSIFEPPQPRF